MLIESSPHVRDFTYRGQMRDSCVIFREKFDIVLKKKRKHVKPSQRSTFLVRTQIYMIFYNVCINFTQSEKKNISVNFTGKTSVNSNVDNNFSLWHEEPFVNSQSRA